MKTIGIIGGISWVSSVDYYRLINEMINHRLGGVNGGRIILYSVNYEDIKTLTFADDWNGMIAMLTGIARKLEGAGADCLLIGANTMHRIADPVQAAISIPLIHIAVETAKAVKEKNIKKVALLGTKFTMELDFFPSKLAAQGIETIIPGDEDRQFLHDAIYEEMGKGLFLPATKARILSMIEQLALQGAEGVIFGCTEIPLLIQDRECVLPVFNTTLIHAGAAVRFALK
ncbi:MAG TPA: aspartate/glutamate racemase family protein [Chitinophagaceae bacterium]|nr:aspartate/glutamate racemase family protein [Chitinophagaceae bacterium]